MSVREADDPDFFTRIQEQTTAASLAFVSNFVAPL